MFLANTFEKDVQNVKCEMRRHPYWLNIPISDMKQTIDMLQHSGFGLEDIYSNIHIVLYSWYVSILFIHFKRSKRIFISVSFYSIELRN